MPFKTPLASQSPAEEQTAREVEKLYEMVTAHRMSQTLRAAAELRIADHVAAGATTSADVAERAGSDPTTTYRLLRACVSLGVLSYSDGRGFDRRDTAIPRLDRTRFITTPSGTTPSGTTPSGSTS